MKQLLTITLTLLTLTTNGQDKYNYVHFNKLTEIVGTEYVIASIENWGKSFGTKSRYLLFINTKTGQSIQVDFPNDGYMENAKHSRTPLKIKHFVSKTKRAIFFCQRTDKIANFTN